MPTGKIDPNFKYQPRNPYKPLAKKQLGKDLWEFLKQQDNVIRMVTETYLGRPAVLGVEKQLLEKFEDKVRNDQIKQMIGDMVFQIMKECGYLAAGGDVSVKPALFTKATQYYIPT